MQEEKAMCTADKTPIDKSECGLASNEHTGSSPWFRPKVDIYETEDALLLRAEVPGADKEGISLEFADGILKLHAHTEHKHSDAQKLLGSEFCQGDFHREFRINEDIDVDKISADHADGVLSVTLPKAEALKPRKIEVKAA